MDETDAEASAGRAQGLADVGRPLVEVERVGRAVAPHRLHEQREHLGLSLGVARGERDHVAAVVLEDGVDAQGHSLAPLGRSIGP